MPDIGEVSSVGELANSVPLNSQNAPLVTNSGRRRAARRTIEPVKLSTQYWLFQTLGWGGYSALGCFFTLQSTRWRPDIVLGYILFFGYSIGLTDLLRREIRCRHWLDHVSLRTVAKLFGIGSLIAVIQTGLIVGFEFLFMGPRSEYIMSPLIILYTWWGVTWVNGTWIGLYIAMTNRRRRQERETRLELALRDAELRALEAQINPHFLFNCLNSIRGLVTEDPKLAQDMITRFATLLRYNLNRDVGHTVPLSAEAEVVADYLALEQVRFDERLRIRFDIDPKAGSIQVPPMLLQTLVENALKHGIGKLPAGGEIRIQAAAEPDTLVLNVENTGQLAGANAEDPRIGLNNIRERLRLLYGDRAVLQLRNRDVNHVAATVRIPAAALP
jgi:hypothetical protein